MSDFFHFEQRKVDDLKIVLETGQPIPVKELVAILRDVNNAFGSYSEANFAGKVDLSVSIRSGSMEIVFDISQKMWEARELLAPFATHLAEVAASLLIHEKVEATAQELKAVESISKPVANGHAQQINLVNHGSVTFVFNYGNAPRLVREARSQRQSHIRDPSKELEVGGLMLNAIERSQLSSSLERGELVGTVFYLDGKWYARMLDSEGVIVPITALKEVARLLKHNEVFHFRGSPQFGSKKQLVALNVYAAVPLSG